jgi:hypothetical protein
MITVTINNSFGKHEAYSTIHRIVTEWLDTE